jgi:hypothetical protein
MIIPCLVSPTDTLMVCSRRFKAAKDAQFEHQKKQEFMQQAKSQSHLNVSLSSL